MRKTDCSKNLEAFVTHPLTNQVDRVSSIRFRRKKPHLIPIKIDWVSPLKKKLHVLTITHWIKSHLAPLKVMCRFVVNKIHYYLKKCFTEHMVDFEFSISFIWCFQTETRPLPSLPNIWPDVKVQQGITTKHGTKKKTKLYKGFFLLSRKTNR